MTGNCTEEGKAGNCCDGIKMTDSGHEMTSEYGKKLWN